MPNVTAPHREPLPCPWKDPKPLSLETAHWPAYIHAYPYPHIHSYAYIFKSKPKSLQAESPKNPRLTPKTLQEPSTKSCGPYLVALVVYSRPAGGFWDTPNPKRGLRGPMAADAVGVQIAECAADAGALLPRACVSQFTVLPKPRPDSRKTRLLPRSWIYHHRYMYQTIRLPNHGSSSS